jgi:hypothetical protein
MIERDRIWKPWRKRAAFACAPLVIALVAGCGDGRPTRVPVSGQVLIDGQPLAEGYLRVHPAVNRAATAQIGPDGRFTLSTYDFGDGCVVGQHLVTVTGSKWINRQTVRWFAPKKYASGAKSGLTIDVSGPTDSAVIQLSWEGGKPFDERIVGGGD